MTMQTIGQINTDQGTVTVSVTFEGEVEMAVIKGGQRILALTYLSEREAAQLGNMLARASIAAEQVVIPRSVRVA